jgi:hypothetical protein
MGSLLFFRAGIDSGAPVMFFVGDRSTRKLFLINHYRRVSCEGEILVL